MYEGINLQLKHSMRILGGGAQSFSILSTVIMAGGPFFFVCLLYGVYVCHNIQEKYCSCDGLRYRIGFNRARCLLQCCFNDRGNGIQNRTDTATRRYNEFTYYDEVNSIARHGSPGIRTNGMHTNGNATRNILYANETLGISTISSDFLEAPPSYKAVTLLDLGRINR